jgi:hypothetical protein
MDAVIYANLRQFTLFQNPALCGYLQSGTKRKWRRIGVAGSHITGWLILPEDLQSGKTL